MFNLSPEEKIILLLSRVQPSHEALESAVKLLTDNSRPIDLARLMEHASMNGVAPLLYCNLKSLNLVRQNAMDRLRSAYLRTVGENVRKGREMMRVLGLLREKGIAAIPLKGPVASDVIFGDPGLYPSGDLDILVKPSDLERTKKILLEAGYKEGEAREEDMLQSSYHILFDKDGYFLEVHWNLAFRYFDVPPLFWWEEAGVAEYEGVQLPVLSAERYVLYSIFRFYSHAFRPLRFFVLSAEIINKDEKVMDWPKLISSARKYKMERLVLFSLKLMRDLLDARIRQETVGRRVFGYGFLKRVILSGLFQEVKKIHLRMLIYTTLLDTPWDTTRVLLRRIFPPLSEVRLRYGLSGVSKKVYAYYLLNPLLMVIRRR